MSTKEHRVRFVKKFSEILPVFFGKIHFVPELPHRDFDRFGQTRFRPQCAERRVGRTAEKLRDPRGVIGIFRFHVEGPDDLRVGIDRTDGLEDLRRDLSIANYRYGGVNWTDGRVLWVQGEKETLETALEQDADENLEQRAKQNYTPAKWDVEKYVQQGNYIVNDDRSNVNWYFLRYSDVLLLYAEALNEWHQGPTTDAYSAINKVRRRAYATSGTSVDLSGLDYEGFQEAVRKERAYELCFEGHRRADLVRWDMYYETIQATYNDLYNWWDWDSNVNKETGEQYYPNYVVYEYTEKGKSELLPIPQREIDLCDQFDQNPGWSND